MARPRRRGCVLGTASAGVSFGRKCSAAASKGWYHLDRDLCQGKVGAETHDRGAIRRPTTRSGSGPRRGCGAKTGCQCGQARSPRTKRDEVNWNEARVPGAGMRVAKAQSATAAWQYGEGNGPTEAAVVRVRCQAGRGRRRLDYAVEIAFASSRGWRPKGHAGEDTPSSSGRRRWRRATSRGRAPKPVQCEMWTWTASPVTASGDIDQPGGAELGKDRDHTSAPADPARTRGGTGIMR